MISVDSSKTDTIANWYRSTNPTELRSFLNLARYHRKFAEGFSKITTPLTRLTKKYLNFEWNNKHKYAFLEWKERLTTVPMLAITKGGEKFIIFSDAFFEGLGYVIIQDGKVIAYGTRQLKSNL